MARATFRVANNLDETGKAMAEAERKRRKAKSYGQLQKLWAKQRGELKRMPLSGRAAMDFIRSGRTTW